MTALSRVRAALAAGERPSDADVRAVCADAERIPLEPTLAMLRAGRFAVMLGRLPNESVDQWIARFWGQMYTAAAIREPK